MNKSFLFLVLLVCAFLTCISGAQELRREVFPLLDLDRPGMEEVKTFHEKGEDREAAKALLAYYRARANTGISGKVSLSEEEEHWANDAVKHIFYVRGVRQDSLFYGEDIDWTYWPVKENELRLQLHRHKWFTPLGKAYRSSGDKMYAEAWVDQYMDWIRKNPLLTSEERKKSRQGGKVAIAEVENMRFAWRPLEVSHRLQDQIMQFRLFLDSPLFTPEFLTEFLLNYHRHAAHIMGHYSQRGNHLLFEAQRMIAAGSFFHEFRDAAIWRKSGIDILNREITAQVYADGGQMELDPGYHLACINIFRKALELAEKNGFRDEFPPSYTEVIEKMIMFHANISFPDYSNPCFSDAKLHGRRTILRNYRVWSGLFPKNEAIRYFATEGREGALPNYLSKGFPDSGFFVFRNSWGMDATQMVVKAGPKAYWHNQPDNGTFELWFKGRRLFPDSGSYMYGGEDEIQEQRDWHRQTCVHNTATLDDRNLETTESVTRLWQPEGDVQVLVTENRSYKDLKHRRSVFFVDSRYFVIVDELDGKAVGTVNLHYQMPEGEVVRENGAMAFSTQFEDGRNLKLQCFGPAGMSVRQEDGWYSEKSRNRRKRMRISFDARKDGAEAIRYMTVIYPVDAGGSVPRFHAEFGHVKFDENGLKVNVSVDGKSRVLSYELDRP